VGKKKMLTIEFSTHERAVFELGYRPILATPDAVALRKMIDTFPFLCRVAENRFDPGVAQAILVGAACNLQAEENIRAAEKKSKEQKPTGYFNKEKK
jgi:hypothetical protein